MENLERKKRYLETLEGMIEYFHKKTTTELERKDLTEEDLIYIEEDIDALGKIIDERNKLILSIKKEMNE